MSTVAVPAPARVSSKPPAWLIVATGALAVIILILAVAETTLWMHYLIDGGEYLSIAGLVFILIAGLYLYRQQQLFVSLPLVAPWLLYPIVTQGDEIIDNLSINPMRIICQILLAAIFGTPVAVVVLAARYGLAPRAGERPTPATWTNWLPGLRFLAEGRTREGAALLAATLMTLEMWVAHQYLGTLMVVTLIAMIVATLYYGSRPAPPAHVGARRSERFALTMLLVGVVASFGLYIGYKNRPGAYQGSPSVFMDKAQKNAGYHLDAIAVPAAPVVTPHDAASAKAVLDTYGRAFLQMTAAYHVLDRNYTWDFHNELFLRNTPLLANYRATGLQQLADAKRVRDDADAQAAMLRPQLAPGDPLAALLDELRAYGDFNFNRGPMLEQMSAGFERTKAGLQHAAHLYEGEGKYATEQLHAIVQKHHAVLTDPAVAALTAGFSKAAEESYAIYASRVVGF